MIFPLLQETRVGYGAGPNIYGVIHSYLRASDHPWVQQIEATHELIPPKKELSSIGKIPTVNRKYIFKGNIFHCYVWLPECNISYPILPL